MNTNIVMNSSMTLTNTCTMTVVSQFTLQIQSLLSFTPIDQLGVSLNALGTVFALELMAMTVSYGFSVMLMPKVNRRTPARIALVTPLLGPLAIMTLDCRLTLTGYRIICRLTGCAVISVVYATAGLRSSNDVGFVLNDIRRSDSPLL